MAEGDRAAAAAQAGAWSWCQTDFWSTLCSDVLWEIVGQSFLYSWEQRLLCHAQGLCLLKQQVKFWKRLTGRKTETSFNILCSSNTCMTCYQWARLDKRHALQRSWPCGVACWEDTIKFAQLVFGLDVPLLNSSDRLPHSSDKSFLLFKGACAEGKPLRKIADLNQPQPEEIEEWNKFAWQPRQIKQIAANAWSWWKDEVLLECTGAACMCRVGHKMCQKECRKRCQTECQKMCQKECQTECRARCKEWQEMCQKECQKDGQKMCQNDCQKRWQKELRNEC